MSELTARDHAVIMSRFLIMKHFAGSASTAETFILFVMFFCNTRDQRQKLGMKEEERGKRGVKELKA